MSGFGALGPRGSSERQRSLYRQVAQVQLDDMSYSFILGHRGCPRTPKQLISSSGTVQLEGMRCFGAQNPKTAHIVEPHLQLEYMSCLGALGPIGLT